MMKHLLFKLSLFFLIFFLQSSVLASVKQHSKLWGTTVIIGPLFKNTQFKYYLEPQLRLMDNRYKFEEAFLYAGIGYQFTPDLILFIGDAPVISRNSEGQWIHQNRIWQQANWNPIHNKLLNLISRTRLEERKITNQSQWAVRLRQRLMWRIPLKNWQDHAVVIFDEGFFDFNHPQWTNTHQFFAQNRAFLGLGTQLTKQITFDIGYLNQYQWTNPKQMSHIALAMLNIITL